MKGIGVGERPFLEFGGVLFPVWFSVSGNGFAKAGGCDDWVYKWWDSEVSGEEESCRCLWEVAWKTESEC